MAVSDDAEVFLHNVMLELRSAMELWPPVNSAHEGYGLLCEELAEFFEHVRAKQKDRDPGAMYRECVQIACVALRTAVEVCNKEGVLK